MHIKRVSIQGFLSYKSVLKLEEFSPQHNAIVGRNGAGKSNFFNAISFVLGDDYSNMGATARNDLLHTGAGASVVRAYVEIVFDNSDGRLPGEPAEVTLQRTIGAKKDEFRLNRKHISKNDVVNLLESAGFSRSNPYYIVRQGKVDRVCKMSNRERLDLLMEVAGTKVYDDRKKQSDAIMESSQARRDQIDEVLQMVTTRLAELEAQKAELLEYQELDKSHRALRYCIFNHEHEFTRDELSRVNVSIEEEKERLAELNTSAADAAARTRQHEQERENAGHAAETARRELARCEAEATELEELKQELNIKLAAVAKQIAAKENEEKDLRRQSAALGTEVEQARSTIDTEVAPQHAQLAEQHRAVAKELQAQITTQNTLNAKLTRHLQYASAEERDVALEEEIEQLEADLAENDASTKAFTTKAKQLHKAAAADAKRKVVLEKKIEMLSGRRQTLGEEMTACDEAQEALLDAQKKIWQKDNDAKLAADQINFRLQNRRKELAMGLCPRHIREGLASVEAIVKREKLAGAYGPLVNLLELTDARFNVAVEVMAKNQLFNYVVDTEATAALLISKLQKAGGFVNFVPLDVVKAAPVVYPEDDSQAVPLIKFLKFDDKFAKAMQQVFGRILLCKDLATATRQARLHRLSCVTLAGEKAHYRGAIECGFVDASKTRIEVMHAIAQAEKDVAAQQQLRAELQAQSNEKQREVTALMGEAQKLRSKQLQVSRELQDANATAKALEAQAPLVEAQVAEAEASLAALVDARKDVEDRVEKRRAELGTPLKCDLTPAELEALAEAKTKIAELTAQERDLGKQLQAAHAKLVEHQSHLNDNLLRRQRDLHAQLKDVATGAALDGDGDSLEGRRLGQLRLDRSATQRKLQKLERQAAAQGKAVDRLTKRIADLAAAADAAAQALDALRGEIANGDSALREATDTMSQLMRRRQTLRAKKDETSRKIADLGSVPAAAVREYRGVTSKKKLRHELKRITSRLAEYSNVNKKALDQFVNFSEQRDTLLARRDKLDAGKTAIEELMEVLDRRKDEAITRTFTDVQKHFQQVFQEIVHDGSGRLIMEYRDGDGVGTGAATGDGQAASESSDDDEQGPGTAPVRAVDSYTGIAVEVSFSGTGETRMMSRLSGGQQAVVALALIFAIQRCDPAPFYLLDEIDQALDSTHRQAVAALIKKQATAVEGTTQFITSTFYPESVEVAAQCYGVYCKNKVSNVQGLSQEEALSFIRDIAAKPTHGQEPAAGATGAGGGAPATPERD